jgi:2-dehydropantoate 2-reductase
VPLAIAVLGAGRVGSTFAYYLARAGHRVSVVARPASTRLEQLRRAGGFVLASGERADVGVGDAFDEGAPYDLVIVTTLAHQVAPLLPVLRRSAARAVQCMFVTLDGERIAEAIGTGRCTLGMPFVRATLDADGKLDAIVGRGPKTLHGERRWADLFAAAGIPSAFEPEMPRWLKCHAPLTIAFESISVYGVRRGGGASGMQAMNVARGLRASYSILEAHGIRPYPRPKAAIARTPTVILAALLWCASRVTSFRELLATGRQECRALIDAMATLAQSATPPLDAAAAAVRAIEPVIEA